MRPVRHESKPGSICTTGERRSYLHSALADRPVAPKAVVGGPRSSSRKRTEASQGPVDRDELLSSGRVAMRGTGRATSGRVGPHADAHGFSEIIETIALWKAIGTSPEVPGVSPIGVRRLSGSSYSRYVSGLTRRDVTEA
jgi:hypothetical protein